MKPPNDEPPMPPSCRNTAVLLLLIGASGAGEYGGSVLSSRRLTPPAPRGGVIVDPSPLLRRNDGKPESRGDVVGACEEEPGSQDSGVR